MDSNHRLPRYKLGASNQLGYSPIGKSVYAHLVPDDTGQSAAARTSSRMRWRRPSVRLRCGGRDVIHADS